MGAGEPRFSGRLKEEPFAVLSSEIASRPNVPVNVLVSLDVLKAGHGWSDEELYDHFLYDLQVRYALGYDGLSDGDFELRTLYNFRQRLSQYNLEHGVNLLAPAFAAITDQHSRRLRCRRAGNGWTRRRSPELSDDESSAVWWRHSSPASAVA